MGQLLPNHLGIYDMSGNVQEWTYITGDYFRLRSGGSYSHSVPWMHLGFDGFFFPMHYRAYNLGFRLVRNP